MENVVQDVAQPSVALPAEHGSGSNVATPNPGDAEIIIPDGMTPEARAKRGRAGENLANVNDGSIEGKLASIQRKYDQDMQNMALTIEGIKGTLKAELQKQNDEFGKCKTYIENKVLEYEARCKEFIDGKIVGSDNQTDVKIQLSKHETQTKIDELDNNIQAIGMNNVQARLDDLETNTKAMQTNTKAIQLKLAVQIAQV